MENIAHLVLKLLRLVLFAQALGLTVISFQAYQMQSNKRLESAFIGFAFISMAVGLTSLQDTLADAVVLLQIIETIPFIIGFGMLYRSLYR